MSDFEPAIQVVLEHEGGYVDDPADPGGATNYGISTRFLRDELGQNPTPASVRAMTREQAVELYRRHWWDAYGYGAIRDQLLGAKVLDMSINMGATQAHKLLQRACNAVGADLAVDGILGPATLGVINATDAGILLGKLVAQQSDFYRALVAAKPYKQRFLAGWLERAAWPLNRRDA